MRPHELWFAKPKPPLLWGWVAIVSGSYLTISTLFGLMALGADPCAAVLGMVGAYFLIGWGILKSLLPRTIEWADLPTPLLMKAQLGIVYAWPTRWGSILLVVSWTRLIQWLVS